MRNPGATPANNPIKQSVHPVTQLACASCAPVWPAAYRVRWPDKESDNGFESSAILPRRLKLAGGFVRLSGRAPCLMQPGTLGGRRCASYQEPCPARAIKSAARKSLGS